jgi:hypothetical protein
MYPPKVSLLWRSGGACVVMNPRAMLAVAYATGRASHARQVKGDYPDEKGYLGPPGWGLGMGLTNPHRKKIICSETQQLASEGWETNVDEMSLEVGFDNGKLEK